MSSLTDYDGLCGMPCLSKFRGGYVRCRFEFGHGARHSWEKTSDCRPWAGPVSFEELEERRQKYEDLMMSYGYHTNTMPATK